MGTCTAIDPTVNQATVDAVTIHDIRQGCYRSAKECTPDSEWKTRFLNAALAGRDGWIQVGPGSLGLLVLPAEGRYVPAFVVASKSVGHVDRHTCSNTMNEYFREAGL